MSADIINVGRYRLLNQIAVGKSTEIWEVIHDAERKRYALKKIRPDAHDAESIGHIRQEYAVGRTLDHPHIIKTLESGLHRKDPYVLLELFRAPNLKIRLHQKGHEALAPLVERFVDESTDALAHLHAKGWVHRDIKPDNFLVADSGEVKLIDFALAQRPKTGLAKFFAGKGKVAGTPSYMSPEQVRGQPLDVRSDIYGYGCTLFELLTGRRPFTGESTNALLTKHLRNTAPSVEVYNRNVTPELAALVRACMSKKPADRPDIHQFRREFKSLKPFKSR